MVAMLAQIAVVTKSAEHELNVRYPALVCFGERPSRCQQIHKHSLHLAQSFGACMTVDWQVFYKVPLKSVGCQELCGVHLVKGKKSTTMLP
eukprot:246502-Pelagomonas_calceolata.AAC.1